MREQGVFLKNGIELPFIWREFCDILTPKDKLPLIRRLEPADNAQRRRLPAAAGAEKRHKGILPDRKA